MYKDCSLGGYIKFYYIEKKNLICLFKSSACLNKLSNNLSMFSCVDSSSFVSSSLMFVFAASNALSSLILSLLLFRFSARGRSFRIGDVSAYGWLNIFLMSFMSTDRCSALGFSSSNFVMSGCILWLSDCTLIDRLLPRDVWLEQEHNFGTIFY